MRRCFILVSLTLAIAASLCAASTSDPTVVTVIVRTDARTGRLVRGVTQPLRTTREKSSAPQIILPPSEDAPPAFRSLVDRIAERHAVDRDLVHSVIRVESNYNPLAVSSKGALGLMQLDPSTARRFGVSDIFSPAQNVDGGVRYLKYLLDLYKGDHRLALAAYNAGESAVERYGGVPPYAETRRYVYTVGKTLDDTKEAKKGKIRAQQPLQAGEGYNPIRAFVSAAGKVYYKTP